MFEPFHNLHVFFILREKKEREREREREREGERDAVSEL